MTRNILLPSITALALLASTPQLFATEAQEREGRQRSIASQSNAKRRSDVQNRRRPPRARPQLPFPTRKHLRRQNFQRPYWRGRRHRPIIAPRYYYPRIYRPSIYPHPFAYRFGFNFNRIDHFGYGWKHRRSIHYPREHYYYDRAHDYSGLLRLKIRPRDAQVYVDNIFVGLVDGFDGPFQRLRLDEGHRVVEIKKPGFEDFQFEMQIIPGEQETVDGLMLPTSRYR
ncbi:MAG: PEGA domain-containing protein [Acidobacteriota bacterium]|nr:PEGA domain-containing protein [Acidobacteriota bacterium]